PQYRARQPDQVHRPGRLRPGERARTRRQDAHPDPKVAANPFPAGDPAPGTVIPSASIRPGLRPITPGYSKPVPVTPTASAWSVRARHRTWTERNDDPDRES